MADVEPGGDTSTVTELPSPELVAAPAAIAGTDPPASLASSTASFTASFTAEWAAADRYALIREIGRGGGGRIALAMDRKLGRRIAVKRPLDHAGAARLEREALVMARLEHPSIVPVHDTGRDADGTPFYAMKLLGGPNLGERIREATTFDARLGLLRVVGAVADAMAYAHAQRVMHRDLKPGNVVVGEFGEVAVIDWGLAKAIGEPAQVTDAAATAPAISAELTREGTVVGTPAYMAPEQATGEPVDERVDVYALGAILYQVLCGELPYGRDGDALVKLRAGPPPRIDEREPRVPADLAAIVHKAMARDPGARYPTARELADDLHRYQTGRVVAAHRYSPWMRARRWLRRRQAGVAIGAAAAIATTAAIVVATRPAVAPEACVGLDAPVGALWSDGARGAIGRAFDATGVKFAPAAWRAASGVLDQRAGAIAAMRLDACRAHERGAESSEALDLRMSCLDARIGQLRAALDVLRAPDAAVVEHAADVAGSVAAIDDCADLARLKDALPLPADPARRAQIASATAALDALTVVIDAGHPGLALARAPAVVGQALAAGHPPVLAGALARFGELIVTRGAHAELAEQVLWSAVAAADLGHDDRARAHALYWLAILESKEREHFDAAERFDDEVAAIAARIGADGILTDALVSRSQIAAKGGHAADAIAFAQRAVEVERRVRPPDPIRDAQLLSNLGARDVEAGLLDDAEREQTRALAMLRAAYGGDDEPAVGVSIGELAAVAYARGDAARAIALYRQAIAIFDRTIAPDAVERLAADQNLATSLTSNGQYADAEAILDDLLPRAEHRLGRTHSVVTSILYNLGDAASFQDKKARAQAMYRESLARRAEVDPSSSETALARAALGTALLDDGQAPAALIELRAASAVLDRSLGPHSFQATIARATLGAAALLDGDAAGAVALLEPAVADLDHTAEPIDRGRFRSMLARARWETGARAAAIATAADARTLLRAAGPAGADELRELEAWSAAHPPRR